MSAWLLDSHALLWWFADDPRLPTSARERIGSPSHRVLVSAASLWEIAIKSRLGKLEVDADLPELFGVVDFEVLAVKTEHAWAVRELPEGPHQDPFDRLLVAQARIERLPIISGDRRLDQYGVERVW